MNNSNFDAILKQMAMEHRPQLPNLALRHVMHAHFDCWRQGQMAAFLDGIIDVFIGVFAQQ